MKTSLMTTIIIDISPEKMLEKLESLRKLMISTPREPMATDIFTHPITGRNDNDDDDIDNNNRLKSQLERELQVLSLSSLSSLSSL